GHPVGFRYQTLVQVAHYVAQGHKDALVAFGFALRAYQTEALVKAQDRTGRWHRRTQGIRQAIRDRDPAYAPDQTWAPAIKFLFPEIADRLKIEGYADANT